MTKKNEPFRKVRRIKITQSTDRGKIFTPKNAIDGYVEFESLGEEALFILLDHDPNCLEIESQPVEIPRSGADNDHYVPDAWAKFVDGKQFLFDVKFHSFFEELQIDAEKAVNLMFTSYPRSKFELTE